ncbi:MAG: methyltransferase domain-containing protein [Clostridia bacterium]|nr:methyltransferase domain-containing protein [Clostridia bacterium]
MVWNPSTYNEFKRIHFSPFNDLFELIHVKDGLKVIDLGCGTGELTRKLADQLPESNVLGIDSSKEMLSKSTEYIRDRVEFKCMSIEAVIESKEQWDLIYSAATIQWVDHHQELIPKLVALVSKGGQIVTQFPSNDSLHTHTTVAEVVKQEPFKSALNDWTRKSPVLSIDEYAEILANSGARNITVFEKVYPQMFEDVDKLIEWVSGTMLLPYFKRLPEELHSSFISAYRERLLAKWPAGPVFYPFRRTFFAATC